MNVSSLGRQGYPLTVAKPWEEGKLSPLEKSRNQPPKGLGTSYGFALEQRSPFATVSFVKASKLSLQPDTKYTLGAGESAGKSRKSSSPPSSSSVWIKQTGCSWNNK